MAADPTMDEVLAVTQADLADCLAALYEADEALLAIMRETEDHRFGRPRYDLTLDHLWETAEPAHSRVRAVLAKPLTGGYRSQSETGIEHGDPGLEDDK